MRTKTAVLGFRRFGGYQATGSPERFNGQAINGLLNGILKEVTWE